MVTTKMVQLPEAQVFLDEAHYNMLWHRRRGHFTADGIGKVVSH